MQIFAEGKLEALLEQQISLLRQEIQNEDRNKLLNVNEDDYISYLISNYQMDLLEFHWDRMSISDSEAMIPANLAPAGFDFRRVKEYRKQVVTYHVPYSGNRDVVRLTPSSWINWSTEVEINQDSISFDIINWNDDPAEVKQQAESIVGNIRTQAEHVNQDIKGFNLSVEKTAHEGVQNRKTQILRQSNLLEQLGVPIRKAESVPETFTVPTVKKKVLVKPAASDAAFAPEPTLDDANYQVILKLCHDTGVQMERLPSVYKGKGEETLRDHFIMVLSPHFESVTGETFNKSGKTDILIRHEKSNVFVAECKFWKGEKGFLDTIDQILSYLTWRDSKAAILNFVKAKELGPVLGQIEPVASRHGCFVRFKGRQIDGWFNFDFHLPTDSSRRVRLAVLCFHFPP